MPKLLQKAFLDLYTEAGRPAMAAVQIAPDALQLTYPLENGAAILATARGEVREFKSLNALISFLRDMDVYEVKLALSNPK